MESLATLERHLFRGKRERDAMTDEAEEKIKALIEMWEVLTAQVDYSEYILQLRAWNAKYQNHPCILKLMSEIEGSIAEALKGYRLDDYISALSSGAVEKPFENNLERDRYRLWDVAGIQDGIQPEYYEGGQKAYLDDRARRWKEWCKNNNTYSAKLLSLQIKYLMESGRPRKDLASIVKSAKLEIEDLPIDLHKNSMSVADWIEAKHIEPLKPMIEKGNNYTQQQKKFRENRQQEDKKKHQQWRKWQSAEKARNKTFAKQSKQEQAKRLKATHSIPDTANTIAKRLDPLPVSKKK